MHSSFLVAALAASASFVSAHSAAIDKRHGSLVDIDTVVGPILEDAEIIDLYKRAAVAKVKADTSLQVKCWLSLPV